MTMHCAHARFVWNLALEQLNCYQSLQQPTPGHLEKKRQLTEVRHSTWLGEGSSHVQQEALRDFDRAVRNWWSGSHRRPTWRRRGSGEGFVIRDLTVRVLSRKRATVHVPKCGAMRFRLSRPLPEGTRSARVTLDCAGRWHVSFTSPQPAFERSTTGAAVGVDVGVIHGFTTSDGRHTSPRGLTPTETARDRRLQRRLRRQVRDSNRYEHTRRSLARVRARSAERRRDWAEKESASLVRQYDVIALEDLDVSRMTRSGGRAKAALNRSILDVGWRHLRARVEQKAAAATSPVEVVVVNPRHTSQRCHPCGHVARANRKSQAVFRCVSCGHEANADVNAARNILGAGLALTGRGGDVRPPTGGSADEASTINLAPARGGQTSRCAVPQTFKNRSPPPVVADQGTDRPE